MEDFLSSACEEWHGRAWKLILQNTKPNINKTQVRGRNAVQEHLKERFPAGRRNGCATLRLVTREIKGYSTLVVPLEQGIME